MQYTNLGRTGLSVSRAVLGTMNFGPETSEPDSFAIMDRAHELGVNFFDTANVYGGEGGRGGARRGDKVLDGNLQGALRGGGRPRGVDHGAGDVEALVERSRHAWFAAHREAVEHDDAAVAEHLAVEDGGARPAGQLGDDLGAVAAVDEARPAVAQHEQRALAVYDGLIA